MRAYDDERDDYPFDDDRETWERRELDRDHELPSYYDVDDEVTSFEEIGPSARSSFYMDVSDSPDDYEFLRVTDEERGQTSLIAQSRHDRDDSWMYDKRLDEWTPARPHLYDVHM